MDLLVIPTNADTWEVLVRLQDLPTDLFPEWNPVAISPAALEGLYEASSPRLQEWERGGECPDVTDEPNGVTYALAPPFGEGVVLRRALPSGALVLPERRAAGTIPVTLLFLTHTDRARLTSVASARLPSGVEVPNFIVGERDAFYDAVLDTAFKGQGKDSALFEGFGPLSACPDCRVSIPDRKLLQSLGVHWIAQDTVQAGNPFGILLPSVPQVKVTRYRMNWDGGRRPLTAVFESASQNENQFTRFRVRGDRGEGPRCGSKEAIDAAERERSVRQALTLAKLTGWQLGHVAARSGVSPDALRARPEEPEPEETWWTRLKQLLR